MRKSEAQRLTKGDVIVYGDAEQGKDTSFHREGRVLHVTPHAGIKVSIIDHNETGLDGTEAWVFYGHVFRKQ